jgi:hypothetical protein
MKSLSPSVEKSDTCWKHITETPRPVKFRRLSVRYITYYWNVTAPDTVLPALNPSGVYFKLDCESFGAYMLMSGMKCLIE